ncbi:M4 family metallopeptidase [Heyndrickxia sporothermodurans]|uniref:M4 family metallopeptidase n=1 Tax=Heyndrickxia sporothermodurans TaxID=46224 RepID=UPI0035D84F40
MNKKKFVIPMILSAAIIGGSFSGGAAYAIQPDDSGYPKIQKMDAKKSLKRDTNHSIFAKKLGVKKKKDVAAINYVEKNKNLLKMKEPAKHLKVKKMEIDKFGMTHVRLQQTKNGIPVEGAEVIVHYDKEGTVQTVNGQYSNDIAEVDLNTKAKITADQAIEKAKEIVSAPKDLDYEPTQELVVYPFNGENYVAYKVNVNFLGEHPGNWDVFIDAKTGDVVDMYNELMHVDGDDYKPMKGVGTGVLGEKRELHISKKKDPKLGNGMMFFLNDINHDHLGGITTYDFENEFDSRTNPLPGKLFAKKNNSWNDDYDRAAVDAHYNSEKVYHYYLDKHGRNSLDDKGMEIKSTVHYGDGYNNAFWNGRQMTYGDGDGQFMISLSAGLDVAAHEMTHGVTTHTAGLKYRNESGALNEAFSDIFGALVNEDSWEIGEDIMAPEAKASGRTALRSMSNPNKFPVNAAYTPYGNGSGVYPKHMDEFYHLPLNLDNGGVHVNSSIINHAAYLTGEQIGKDKLGQIYYRALTVYLTPDSNFSDARQALIQSAIDIYGENSTEAQATENGLNQVGILQ